MTAIRRTPPTAVLLLVTLAAPGPAAPAEEANARAESLRRLRESTARYEVETASDSETTLRFREEPVLRWNAPRMDITDAAVFLWLDGDRPHAVVGPYVSPAHGGTYIQFHSLSPEPLVTRQGEEAVWSPEAPGLTWTAVPDGPVPAETPRARLAQMRSLAEGFQTTAIKGPPNYEPGSTWQLRLMPQPIYRYGGAAGGPLDGAMFSLALGTDPEAFLLLEARRDSAGGAEWYFSLASWCESELETRYGDEVVWLRPQLEEWDPRGPYFRLGPYAPSASDLALPDAGAEEE